MTPPPRPRRPAQTYAQVDRPPGRDPRGPLPRGGRHHRAAGLHPLLPRLRPLHLESRLPGPRAGLDAVGHRLHHQGRRHGGLGDAAGGSGQARPRRPGGPLPAAVLGRPQEPGDRAHAAGPHQRPQELSADLQARRREPVAHDLPALRPTAGPSPGRLRRLQRLQRHAHGPGDRVDRQDHARPLRRHRGVRSHRHGADPFSVSARAQARAPRRAGSGGASRCRAT